jgi:uncharacterized flavoprotein (TIGR03862 family)
MLIPPAPPPIVAVIGAGPAGLLAAEHLARAGARVTVFDRMPAPGRKLLLAGRGGLNLTHSEPLPTFLARYGEAAAPLAPIIAAFPPAALIAWADGLGADCFTGSSGRVFPRAMKASPLLRAWLGRLAGIGITLRTRHRWLGWDAAGALRFATPDTEQSFHADAAVLALGGASWPRLGAVGDWPALLPGVRVLPWQPTNVGFRVAWTAPFRARFAGTPLKRLGLSHAGRTVLGEAMVTATGIEGGAVYALSAALRDTIARDGHAILHLDLRPDLAPTALAAWLDGSRGAVSLANWLRRAGLPPVGLGLVQEALRTGPVPASLSALVKALPLRLDAPAPIERAISSAGGLAWDELDAGLMLRRLPGVFAAGEMLDWEAPTGGYLLQACLATGRAAAAGALDWLGRPDSRTT